MKILFAASECTPIVKVGGLGDVIGSLPKALAKLGLKVEIVLPFYKDIDTKTFPVEQTGKDIPVPFGDLDETINVYKTYLGGPQPLPIYLLENKRFLSGGGVYFSPDAFVDSKQEIDRFAFFSRAVLEFIKAQRQKCDIVHCNDWHTGIIPDLIKLEKLDIASVFTIHNLANQGLWELTLMDDLLINSKDLKVIEWDTRDQNLDLILQGILGADVISTVSSSYAKEIMTPEFGEGLDTVLKAREGRIFGILNGIDVERFNPAMDPNLVANYRLGTRGEKWEVGGESGSGGEDEGKRINKVALQKMVGLEINPDIPLIGMVTRIVEQKGFEIIIKAFDKMMSLSIQFVLLGLGDPRYQQFLKEKSGQNKGSAAVVYKFDSKLAQQIYAGSDMFLMPSRFEPCGLGQMIAMRYGNIPIVREVGGLKDSVKDGITGFVFKDFESSALVNTVHKALQVFHNKTLWHNMIRNAMKEDFSWNRSAKEYVRLYEKAVDDY